MKIGSFLKCAAVAALGLSVVFASGGAWAVSEDALWRTKAALHREATGEELVYGSSARSVLPVGSQRQKSVGVVTVSNVRAEQRKGTKLVDVTYDLTSTASYKCHVDFALTRGGSPVSVSSLTGDVGDWVSPGSSRRITWNAGADAPSTRSFDYKASVTAYEMAEQVSEQWVTITVAWAEYHGTDIDLCGYWVNAPDSQFGWSHGQGAQNTTYRALWRGDNTGSGPEYMLVSPCSTHRQFRIHANHYGTAGSPSRVDVTVTGNGVTKSITSRAGTSSHSKATTSHPYVTITFDENGTPTDITRSANL